MPSTISNMTNSTSLDGLLKNVYLPTLQETTYKDNGVADLIPVRDDLIDAGGNNIVHFALTQGSEGVGAISEGGNWVSSVPVKGKQMTENVKYLNAYLSLTGPLIKAANSGVKSQVNAVTKHFSTNIEAFRNNFNRMLSGDGSGRLALISAVDTGSSTITVTKTSFALAPFNADQFLPVGSRVNIATFDSSGVATSGFCNSNSDDDYGFIVTGVSSRDIANGTAVLTITDEDGGDYSGGGTTDIAAGDYVVREGAYGTASTSAALFSACLEINGISNLVSDGSNNSETTSNYTSNWGLTRTSYSNLQSYTKDFSDEITEDNLLSMMVEMQYSRQANPNVLVTTPKAQLKYFSNTGQADRRFNTVGPMEFTGGFTELGIQLGQRRLRIRVLPSIPAGTLSMLNTNDFAFAQSGPFSWVLGDGGNVLVQSHTGDTKFASAVQYVNLVCFDPYRQGKGYSITE